MNIGRDLVKYMHGAEKAFSCSICTHIKPPAAPVVIIENGFVSLKLCENCYLFLKKIL